MTGTVTGGGTMGGTAMTGTREVAGDSPAMNLPGTEMVVEADMEASPEIEMVEGVETEMDTPEMVAGKGRLLRKDLSLLWLQGQRQKRMPKVELLSQVSLEELSLLTLSRRRRRLKRSCK